TFGLALLSLHPIRNVRAALVPSAADHAVLLLATLDLDGRALEVAVTHLGGPDAYRRRQAEVLAEALGAVEGPLLVLGDFNADGASRELAAIRAGARLDDVAVDGIDRVLYRALAARPAQVPDTGGVSDHRPGGATF